MDPRITRATEAAVLAFWERIADHFPELRSGDLDPETVVRFDQFCEQTVATYIRLNTM